MQQYFIQEEILLNQPIEMNQEDFHHISHVLRMKENDCIRLCDEKAMYFAKLHFTQGTLYAIPYEIIPDHTKTSIPITLAMGLIKGEKWDFVIQKACELGVHQIIPFTSSRCVVKTKTDKIDKKLERWNKIAKEACEQCKRSTIATISSPITYQQLHHQTNEQTLKLIAYEDADLTGNHFASLLSQYPTCQEILIVIGPEGGFSKEEVQFFLQQGFHCISLGGRILRAETAALYTLSTIDFYYDLIKKDLITK